MLSNRSEASQISSCKCFAITIFFYRQSNVAQLISTGFPLRLFPSWLVRSMMQFFAFAMILLSRINKTRMTQTSSNTLANDYFFLATQYLRDSYREMNIIWICLIILSPWVDYWILCELIHVFPSWQFDITDGETFRSSFGPFNPFNLFFGRTTTRDRGKLFIALTAARWGRNSAQNLPQDVFPKIWASSLPADMVWIFARSLNPDKQTIDFAQK